MCCSDMLGRRFYNPYYEKGPGVQSAAELLLPKSLTHVKRLRSVTCPSVLLIPDQSLGLVVFNLRSNAEAAGKSSSLTLKYYFLYKLVLCCQDAAWHSHPRSDGTLISG